MSQITQVLLERLDEVKLAVFVAMSRKLFRSGDG